MKSVAIIGAGDLAGAAAQALAARDHVSRVLLVDTSAKVAAGKALDIMQAGAIAGFHARLDGTDDLTRVTGCDVCIVADRVAAADWQGDEGLAMLRRLIPYLSSVPLVFAGAHQASLIELAGRELGVPRTRLVGSVSEALASATRSIVAMEARCSPREVALTVLGAPPGRFVVPWSEAAIGGYALDRVLDQVQVARIEARAASLWPPGPYALGLAAARVAEAILDSSRASFAVLTMLAGEFGATTRVATLPVLLSATGIVHTRVPALNPRERVLVGTALGI
jgi:malate dehydrogenase